MGRFNQKGVSVLFAVLALSIILTIVFGLTTLIATQMKSVKNVGNSVIAFYAADAGIEPMIKFILEGGTPLSSYSKVFIGPSSYKINVVCCQAGVGSCVFDGSTPSAICPAGLIIKSTCGAPRYCITSVGAYPDPSPASANVSKRAIQVEI